MLIFWIFNPHIRSFPLQHLGDVRFYELQTLTLSHLTPMPIHMAYVSRPFDTNCNAPILMSTILSMLGPMPLMALFFFQAQRWIFNPYTRSSLLHTQVIWDSIDCKPSPHRTHANPHGQSLLAFVTLVRQYVLQIIS